MVDTKMASKIPISIPMLRRRTKRNIDSANNPDPKIPNSTKLSKKKKSPPRIWSLFRKWQPEDEAKLNERMGKKLHPLGRVPAYLNERSQNFYMEESIPKCESKIIPPNTAGSNDPDQHPSDICSTLNKVQPELTSPSNAIIKIIENYSAGHESDLKFCAKSRKELELQLNELHRVVQKLKAENRFLDGLRCEEMLSFLEAFLTCVSFYGNESVSKKDAKSLVEEEELQNLLATIGHLDFKSFQHWKMIEVLRVRNRRYRKQVEKLQFYVRQCRERNKTLKKKTAELKRQPK